MICEIHGPEDPQEAAATIVALGKEGQADTCYVCDSCLDEYLHDLRPGETLQRGQTVLIQYWR